jgi:hypothetical protein
MKRIIYFISIVLGSALYSCSGQYDNIEQYATDETIYVGKYEDMPMVQIGYNRVEIDLMPFEGRIAPDDIYLGKAKKTVVEYDEMDGLHKRVFDSVCSWVNIDSLYSPKTYIFRIYTEDDYGNKSIPIEALGRPFTDDDLAGLSFPLPYVIPTPTTMEFRWTEDSGLSSSLFTFAELIYSYTDRNNKVITDTLTSKDIPRFSIADLQMSDVIPISVTCRIIPIMETGPIMDTVTMKRVFEAKTASIEEYLNARTLRPVDAAMIHNDDLSKATITWGKVTDHLMWTKLRYTHADGTVEEVHLDNDQSTTLCENIKRGVKFQIRCAFKPPLTDEEFVTGWIDHESAFMVKYERNNWVVVPKGGNHPWGGDGIGAQNVWDGGHPMLILDDDLTSGWHSQLSAALPQVLVIDMKESKAVSKVILYTKGDGYWNNIELYLTNEAIPDYVSHTINWDALPSTRVSDYASWVNPMIANIRNKMSTFPAASWGSPIAKVQSKHYQVFPILLPKTVQGRFLVVMFPDNTLGWASYINVESVEVYSE